MSRGLGPTQRRVLAVVAQGVDGEFAALEISYLKALAGGDRSNLRRAIRGLLRRRLIRERIEGGRRYYGLTLLGYILAIPLDPATAPNLLGTTALSLRRDTLMGARGVGQEPTQKKASVAGASKRGKREAVTQRGIAR